MKWDSNSLIIFKAKSSKISVFVSLMT